jgi:hypothetical protein
MIEHMDYEVQIYGCAFGCPLQMREKDCPFNEVDHLSIKEKVIWMKSQSLENKKSIIEHHISCTKKRDQK